MSLKFGFKTTEIKDSRSISQNIAILMTVTYKQTCENHDAQGLFQVFVSHCKGHFSAPSFGPDIPVSLGLSFQIAYSKTDACGNIPKIPKNRPILQFHWFKITSPLFSLVHYFLDHHNFSHLSPGLGNPTGSVPRYGERRRTGFRAKRRPILWPIYGDFP